MADKPTATAKAAARASAPDAKKCRIANCKRPYRAKGYCVTHYRLWRRGEIAKVPGQRGPRYKQCGKEDCRKPAVQTGLCQAHFDESRGVTPATEAAPAAA